MYGEVGGLLAESLSEVLTAANTRPSAPAARVRRLMWSSARSCPESATSSVHAMSAAPSVWTANRNLPRSWLDHMTPIAPRMRTMAEMSSEDTEIPATGGLNGLLQLLSTPDTLCAT